MSSKVTRQVLRTKEAAYYLGVNEKTMRRWRLATKRKGEQVGPKWVDLEGRIGYLAKDLDRYLADRVNVPGESDDGFAA